jgi:hypothetical protein
VAFFILAFSGFSSLRTSYASACFSLRAFALKKERCETQSPALGGERRLSWSPGKREFMMDCGAFLPKRSGYADLWY